MASHWPCGRRGVVFHVTPPHAPPPVSNRHVEPTYLLTSFYGLIIQVNSSLICESTYKVNSENYLENYLLTFIFTRYIRLYLCPVLFLKDNVNILVKKSDY